MLMGDRYDRWAEAKRGVNGGLGKRKTEKFKFQSRWIIHIFEAQVIIKGIASSSFVWKHKEKNEFKLKTT